MFFTLFCVIFIFHFYSNFYNHNKKNNIKCIKARCVRLDDFTLMKFKNENNSVMPCLEISAHTNNTIFFFLSKGMVDTKFLLVMIDEDGMERSTLSQ